jgi:hypothetical protein
MSSWYFKEISLTSKNICMMDTLFANRTHVANAKNLLKMYPNYNKKASHNFVTGDEAWVYYFEPLKMQNI